MIEIKNKSLEKVLSNVITVNPNNSIHDALREMQTNFIKHIVVVDKHEPVGVVTERDIARFLENDKTAKALNEIPIKHVMSKNPVIIQISDESDYLNQASVKMTSLKISSIILTDDNNHLVGIITSTDITKAYSIVLGGKFLVKDYLNEKIASCRKSDSLQFALGIINNNKISRLIVTDDSGKSVGMISTKNFMNHSDYFTKNNKSRDYLLSQDQNEICVGDIMSKDILTITQDEDLAKAANLMTKNKISGIPVLDNGKKLVGVITKSDIVLAFLNVNSHEWLKSQYSKFY